MLKKILPIFVFLCIVTNIIVAQHESKPNPCGTAPLKSKWLEEYQHNRMAFSSGGDTIIYVPLTIHLVGNDGGTGYFGLNYLMNAFCQLNKDFEQTNIRFYIKGNINYIPNNAYNNHATVLDGAYMMLANNVEKTLNCYFVQGAAGNCGYNLPFAGMCVAKSCAGPYDHTWAHEMGHALSLPHPFLGWEGMDYNYAETTPDSITNSAYTFFQDYLVTNPDTLIYATYKVELLDGSNCSTAADGFCDTKSDYISYRWECDSMSNSLLKQKDQLGNDFYSNGTWIMSYSYDECQVGFSGEQTAAMRANLLSEYITYLDNQSFEAAVSEEPFQFIAPINNALVQYDDVTLEWEAVPNATHYVIQVSRLQNFAALDAELISDTNNYHFNNLLNNKTYYWRVRPYNNYGSCAPMSDKTSFKTGIVSATNDFAALNEFKLTPSILKAGETLDMSFQLTKSSKIQLLLSDINGQIIAKQNSFFDIGNNYISISTEGLSSGIYLIGLVSDKGLIYRKFIIQ